MDAGAISPIRRKILEVSDSRNSVWRVRDGATGESNNRDARPQSVRGMYLQVAHYYILHTAIYFVLISNWLTD